MLCRRGATGSDADDSIFLKNLQPILADLNDRETPVTDQAFVTAALDSAQMKSAPINPDWIVEGSPVARMAELSRSRDGTTVSVAWDCTAGTFKWYFGIDETVHILAGSVVVSGEDGVERRLNPGDVALFHSGSWTTWRVDAYVRKLAFCRHAMPVPLGFMLRAVHKLQALVTGKGGNAIAAAPDEKAA